jgi:hypothetical protein
MARQATRSKPNSYGSRSWQISSMVLACRSVGRHSGSAEMMALALPALHRLLPYAGAAMLTADLPSSEGFPFLATVIESLAEGIGAALSFHGVSVLHQQLLHAVSLVFDMAAPQHLPRETLSMLVLSLCKLALRASASPPPAPAPTAATATATTLPLSDL